MNNPVINFIRGKTLPTVYYTFFTVLPLGIYYVIDGKKATNVVLGAFVAWNLFNIIIDGIQVWKDQTVTQKEKKHYSLNTASFFLVTHLALITHMLFVNGVEFGLVHGSVLCSITSIYLKLERDYVFFEKNQASSENKDDEENNSDFEDTQFNQAA